MLRRLQAPGSKLKLTRAEKPPPVADDWVQRMIDSPGRSGRLVSGDHVTHYLEWGASDNPRIMLLLHGFRGHAHWWDFIAPWFAADYRVIAIDFGGMGDSSTRLKYTRDSFVEEVEAILAMLKSNSVTLIGHSFGGRVSVFVAHRCAQYLKRAIVIDSNIGFADQTVRPKFMARPKQVYPDLATACARFRFMPEEPPILPKIMQHLAFHSLRREGGGFVWKFDDALLTNIEWEQVSEGELFADIKIPLDFIAGEFSAVVPPELVARIGKALRSGRGPIVIPSAYHHIPADQPLALAAALRALLS